MRSNIVVLLVICISLLVSCKTELTKVVIRFGNGNIERIYYIDQDSLKQGEVIAYHKNGNILFKSSYTDNDLKDTIYYYKNNVNNRLESKKIWIDDSFFYYKQYNKNGQVTQEGLSDTKNRRINIWKFYNEDGSLNYIKEFKIINGKSYTNQLWQLLSNGDTLNVGANMKYKVAPRKVKLGDSIRFFFQSDVAQFGENSDFTVTIPKDYTKQNFNADFSNTEDEYRKPGKYSKHIYSLKYDNTYPKEKIKVDTTDHYKTVLFYLKPKRVDKDTIRGYFREWHSTIAGLPNLWWRYNRKEIKTMNSSDEGTFDTKETSIYFDIPIEVYE